MERVMTIVASCKLQKRKILAFITEVIKAHLSRIKVPSLIF